MTPRSTNDNGEHALCLPRPSEQFATMLAGRIRSRAAEQVGIESQRAQRRRNARQPLRGRVSLPTKRIAGWGSASRHAYGDNWIGRVDHSVHAPSSVAGARAEPQAGARVLRLRAQIRTAACRSSGCGREKAVRVDDSALRTTVRQMTFRFGTAPRAAGRSGSRTGSTTVSGPRTIVRSDPTARRRTELSGGRRYRRRR